MRFKIPRDLEVKLTDIRLQGLIGTGATAYVYRALWRGRLVAVKRLHVSIDHSASKDFFRELQVMIRLSHHNLVMLMGAVTTSKPLCLITEYCDGGTLFDLLHGRNRPPFPLSWSQKMKLCLDIAKGCAYLHTSNPIIIHRDLKSLNILLGKKVVHRQDCPVAKVSDFGLSRIKAGGGWGQMTAGAGTYHWMAPEVLMNRPYNETADVYSYGIVAYEIISGLIPYADRDAPPIAIAMLVARGLRPNLRALPADCPPRLSHLIQRCWSQDPKLRPPFTAILEEIRRIVT